MKKIITSYKLANTVINRLIAKNIKTMTINRLIFMLIIIYLAEKQIGQNRIVFFNAKLYGKRIEIDEIRYIGLDLKNYNNKDIYITGKLSDIIDTVIKQFAEIDYKHIQNIISKFTIDESCNILYLIDNKIKKI